MSETTTGKKPVSGFVAVAALAIIVAAIVVSIRLGFGTQMSVFVGAVVSVVIAMILKVKWADIEKATLENIAHYNGAFVILILVGVMIGTWLIGGTLPTLIYYGLEVVSPSALVPLTFILCAITSVCTGTSFGCIATMGLAMYGVGLSMGISTGLIAGAVVSGAYFGDKLSPMSDTTNLAPAIAGNTLYSHIGSMLYSQIPATIVCIILYAVFGAKATAGDSVDLSAVELMKETLQANFNINFICLIPLILVLVLAILKVPSFLAMGASAVLSLFVAKFTQGVTFSTILGCAMNGYVSDTGVALVDKILSRGGVVSMAGTIALLLFAGFMAGALQAAGILEVFSSAMIKFVKTGKSLIVSTLVFCWGIVLLSGNQMMGIIVPGKAMGDLFDKMDVDRKVLSRTLEDGGTLSAPLVPWSTAAAYTMGVLGVGTEYIPYTFLCFVIPLFSLLCAFTGFGMWNSKGEKMWGKGKK